MIESAHAILVLGGNYVLQLRDNDPSVSAAGQWSLFGGRVEENEDPVEAVSREVFEELSIIPFAYRFLWSMNRYTEFEQVVIRLWFFEAHVDEVWSGHCLKEGQAVLAFSLEQLADIDIPLVIREALERHHSKKHRI